MTANVVMLSLPGLRQQDLASMPRLSACMQAGQQIKLVNSFPAVTWPSQATMLTGARTSGHGVIGNGFYWRDEQKVEMWTAANGVIQQPQIWDVLKSKRPDTTSAAWFPMLSKECGADYVCMPAPIHNPDGSESLWCYTKPTELYGDLRDELGHFPLQHFWGPLAGIQSSDWIIDSASIAADRWHPNFFYIYLPHLDYAAQKYGPESPQAAAALKDLDTSIGRLVDRFTLAYDGHPLTWVAVSEYTIQPVDHVTYPNRALRQAGLLQVKEGEGEQLGEQLDVERSDAWAMVDHQLSHVFVKDRNPATVKSVVDLFRDMTGIAEVLDRNKLRMRSMNHERTGDVVLISDRNSWQAYYWWENDERAPDFARTVDIHRKPGYDPVELFVDMPSRQIPLDATLVKGSHGAPVTSQTTDGVWLSSRKLVSTNGAINDYEVAGIVLQTLGCGG